MIIEPSPCPFCGGHPIRQNTDEHRIHTSTECAGRLVYYACLECKAYGPDMPDAMQALVAWNKRVDLTGEFGLWRARVLACLDVLQAVEPIAGAAFQVRSAPGAFGHEHVLIPVGQMARLEDAWKTYVENAMLERDIDERWLPPVHLGESHSYERGVMLAMRQGAQFSKRLGERDDEHSVTKFWRAGKKNGLEYALLRHKGGSTWILEPWQDSTHEVPMDADMLYPEQQLKDAKERLRRQQ